MVHPARLPVRMRRRGAVEAPGRPRRARQSTDELHRPSAPPRRGVHASGRRSAARPALRGRLRMRSQGPPHGQERLDLSVARAPRPHRQRCRRGCFARPTASAFGSRPATRCEVKGRIERFRGELVAELDDVERIEPGSYDPGGLPARRLSLGGGARGIPGAPRLRDPPRRPARRGGRARRRRARTPRSSAARRAPSGAITPTSAVLSSTRSPSARSCSRPASSIPASTRTS